jgi:tripartite-type tricarboxylate transporter receptor subunit TctC
MATVSGGDADGTLNERAAARRRASSGARLHRREEEGPCSRARGSWRWRRCSRSPHWLLQSYPSKPLRILLSGGAGGPNDIQSRGVAQALQQSLGQPYLPDIPVTKELGIDLPLRTWHGLFAPAGMPRDITLRLNAEVNRVLTQPAFIEKMMAPVGISAAKVGSPEDLAAFMKRDRESFAQLAKLIGLKPEP